MTLSKVKEAEVRINRERGLAGKKPIEVKEHKLKGLTTVAVKTLEEWYDQQWTKGLIFKSMKLTSFCALVNDALLVDPHNFLITLTPNACRHALESIGKSENHPARKPKPKPITTATPASIPPFIPETTTGTVSGAVVTSVYEDDVVRVMTRINNNVERMARFVVANTNLLLRTSVKRDPDDDFEDTRVLVDDKYIEDLNMLGINGSKEEITARSITTDDLFIGPKSLEITIVNNLGERKRLIKRQGRFEFIDFPDAGV